MRRPVIGFCAAILAGLVPVAAAAADACPRSAGPAFSGLSLARSWRSTAGKVAWTTPADVGPLAVGHNPWGAADMAAEDALETDLFVGANDTARLRVRAGAPATSTGMPKGAPYMLVGLHADHASRNNPFTTRGTTGIWTDSLKGLRAETSGTLIASDPGARYAHALQTYLYFDRYTGSAHDGAPYLDIMVVFNRVRLPSCCIVADRVIDGRRFTIERVDVGGYKDNFYTVHLSGPARTSLSIDLLAVIQTIRELHNAHTGRTDTRYWMRSVGTWLEPFFGRIDYVIDGLRVTVDGRDYGAVVCGQ